MEELNNESEGTTQAPEMVSIPEADDADLEAFLESNKYSDSESEDEEVLEDELTDKEPEAKSPPAEEKKQEPKPSKEETEAQLAAEKERNEKLKAHAKNVELWNARQATEIGNLRKQLKEAIAKKSEGLEEKFLTNPLDATKVMDEIKDAEKDLKVLDEHEQKLNFRAQSYAVVTKHIAEDELDVAAMAETLARDGIPQDFLQRFTSDPFAEAHGETIIQLNKRAVAEKRLYGEAVPLIKQLVEENKRLKEGKRNVLSGVERASRQMPSVTASNGGAVATSRGSIKNISNLSDAELEELLKSNR